MVKVIQDIIQTPKLLIFTRQMNQTTIKRIKNPHKINNISYNKMKRYQNKKILKVIKKIKFNKITK
jgi:hypothetical protein